MEKKLCKECAQVGRVQRMYNKFTNPPDPTIKVLRERWTVPSTDVEMGNSARTRAIKYLLTTTALPEQESLRLSRGGGVFCVRERHPWLFWSTLLEMR